MLTDWHSNWIACKLQATNNAEMKLILLRDKIVYLDECIYKDIFHYVGSDHGICRASRVDMFTGCSDIKWSLGAPFIGGLDSWIFLIIRDWGADSLLCFDTCKDKILLYLRVISLVYNIQTQILLSALKCFQIHSQSPSTLILFIYLCFVYDIQFLQNQS